MTTDPKTPVENSYSKNLGKLISGLLSGSRFQLSIYGTAARFFSRDEQDTAEIAALQQTWEQSQAQLAQANRKTEALLIADVQQKRQQLFDAEYRYEQLQQQRYAQLYLLCQQLLELTEGQNRQETILRSSRLLGTLQLMAPSEGDGMAAMQQKYKPFYKAVLSLRLLDHLLEQNLITNSYILKKNTQRQQMLQLPDQQAYCPFRDDVQIPLLMAVLLQDVGHYHPDAMRLLQADGSQPNYRLQFSNTERQEFVEISLQASVRFLLKGIGMPVYRGNSKSERAEYQQNEQEKMAFAATVLRTAATPGSGVGNLLRIPQVYASAVLPGRARFVYESLPKVALILKNGARAGQYDERMVDQLLTITGIFPQGYGIVYLPKDKTNASAERYEFAIVNSLYPPSPETPLCRGVTRNLRYRTSGTNLAVSVEHNLYFKPARQKLAVIPEARLQEILSKLSSSFEPAQLRHFLPRSWHPDEFFADPKHQNLWNRNELQQN